VSWCNNETATVHQSRTDDFLRTFRCHSPACRAL
jgi:hypothetical protein